MSFWKNDSLLVGISCDHVDFAKQTNVINICVEVTTSEKRAMSANHSDWPIVMSFF